MSGQDAAESPTARFEATAEDQVFYVIIDGWGSGAGLATVSIAAVPSGEAGLCTDGEDNDLDGLPDCADPDCAGESACDESNAALYGDDACLNGDDDDGDGYFDCEDPDCLATQGDCSEALGSGRCGDGLDNDGDGVSDCADPDCKAADPAGCAVPAGDLCANAVVIGALPYSDPAAPGTDADPSTCDYGVDHRFVSDDPGGCQSTELAGSAEKVWVYTAADDVVVDVLLVPTGGGDPVLNVSRECVVGTAPARCVASSDFGYDGDTEAIVGLPLRAGETVYIYGAMWYADGCGPFEMSVTESAP